LFPDTAFSSSGMTQGWWGTLYEKGCVQIKKRPQGALNTL